MILLDEGLQISESPFILSISAIQSKYEWDWETVK